MPKTLKKLLILLLVLALPLSLAACGGGDQGGGNAGKAPVENGADQDGAPAKGDGTPVLVVEKDINAGDEGKGPVVISSRFGELYIPDGFEYDLDYAPEYDTVTDSQMVFVWEDHFYQTEFIIRTTTDATSYETAIDHAIYWYQEDDGTYEMRDEHKLGDLTFQNIYFENLYGNDDIYVSFYKTEDGENAYVAINLTKKMSIDDPKLVEMFEKSKFK